MTRRRVKEMSEDEKKEEGRRVYQLMAYNMAVDVIDGKIDRCPVAVGIGNLHSSLSDQEDESERVHAAKPVEGVGVACVQGSRRKVNIIVQ